MKNLMNFDLNQAIAQLAKTPMVLNTWLAGLPREWTESNEGPETWSSYDVIGHLIHGERTDWIPRVKIILEFGESRSFDPFAQFTESRGRTLEELLAEFAALREESLSTLRGLEIGAAELEKTGHHPALGRVSLKELLATWVAHDLDHLGQIARTMARQYLHEVGPWQAYLSILKAR
jgi:DinB family protein